MPGGRKADTIGRNAEKWLTRACVAYRESGRAIVYPLPVAVATRRGRTVRIRPSPFDFFGIVTTGINPPIPYAMECKASEKRRTSLQIYESQTNAGASSGLAVHQLDALADWIEFGGNGHIIWRNGGQWTRLDSDGVCDWRTRYHGGERKSIPAVAFAAFDDEIDGAPAFLGR